MCGTSAVQVDKFFLYHRYRTKYHSVILSNGLNGCPDIEFSIQNKDRHLSFIECLFLLKSVRLYSNVRTMKRKDISNNYRTS